LQCNIAAPTWLGFPGQHNTKGSYLFEECGHDKLGRQKHQQYHTQNFVNVKVALTAQNFKVHLHWQSLLGHNCNAILPPLLGLAFLDSTTQKDHIYLRSVAMASKAGKNISNITQNFVNVKVALTA
jgi:hypothetical protein